MLMPSPTIGCASPAALPTRKTPSPCPSRTPGRIGPAASQAPSRRRASRARRQRRAHSRRRMRTRTRRRRAAPGRGAGDRGERVAADAAGERRARRRRRPPCRRSRRGTPAPATGRAGTCAVAEVRLEGEQVARPALLAPRRAAPTAAAPTSRARRPRARAFARSTSAAPAIAAVAAAGEAARPGARSPAAPTVGTPGRRRHAAPGAEHGVEVLAAERAAPRAAPVRRPAAAPRPRSSRRAQQRHPAQPAPATARDRCADAEHVEQRQLGRGDALAADLAARKRAALDQRDRPAGAREQDRRGAAGRAGADDDRVEALALIGRRADEMARSMA